MLKSLGETVNAGAQNLRESAKKVTNASKPAHKSKHDGSKHHRHSATGIKIAVHESSSSVLDERAEIRICDCNLRTIVVTASAILAFVSIIMYVSNQSGISEKFHEDKAKVLNVKVSDLESGAAMIELQSESNTTDDAHDEAINRMRNITGGFINMSKTLLNDSATLKSNIIINQRSIEQMKHEIQTKPLISVTSTMVQVEEIQRKEQTLMDDLERYNDTLMDVKNKNEGVIQKVDMATIAIAQGYMELPDGWFTIFNGYKYKILEVYDDHLYSQDHCKFMKGYKDKNVDMAYNIFELYYRLRLANYLLNERPGEQFWIGLTIYFTDWTWGKTIIVHDLSTLDWYDPSDVHRVSSGDCTLYPNLTRASCLSNHRPICEMPLL